MGSGAAGLIYQVVWSRELVLLFGNTSQAISTIVTAFLFGLGFGALGGARLSRRTANPLRVYAVLEVLVALLAVGVAGVLPLLGTVYSGAYTSVSPATLGLIRFALAFVALVPATLVMGATLPLLTAHFVNGLEDAGRRIGRLYAANTLGAVLGTLVAGFVLIELFGLTATSAVAVALNLIAGGGALYLSRRRDRQAESRPMVVTQRSMRGLIYAASFVAGFCALALEVLWNRLLAEGSGSNIYLFAAILAIYLFGIGAGSSYYSSRSARPHSLATLGGVLALVGVTAALITLLVSGPLGGGHYTVRPLLLLPATLAMGYSFPLSVRLLIGSANEAAAGIGALYAANTAGSVVGAFSAVFVLAGWVGTNSSIFIVAAAELAVGAVLIVASSRSGPVRWRLPKAALVAAASIGLVLATSSGLPVTRTFTQQELITAGVLADHREDVISTVDAIGGATWKRRLIVAGVGMTNLTYETKLMAYLPKMLRPQSTRLLDICFGMGSTYRSSLLLGMRTDAVELSPSVPGEMGVYFPDARRYLNDPRGRVIIGDGRNYVRLTRERYDVISVDPPPPVESAGTVVLYTREFMKEASERLVPGGLFLEWVPFTITLAEFRDHVRTMQAVFPHMALVVGGAGVYVLGSSAPMSLDPAAVRAVLAQPDALSDLNDSPNARAGWTADYWLSKLQSDWWLTDGQVDAFAGPGPIITDDHPISEYFLIRRILIGDHEHITRRSLLGGSATGADGRAP